MAVHEATDVAWALLPKRSGALDAPHSALLYEGLASGAVLSKVVKEQVADLKDTWEAQKQMPRCGIPKELKSLQNSRGGMLKSMHKKL